MLSPYNRARVLLVTSALLCFGLFYLAGAVFSIPYHRAFEMSYMQQPHPTAGLVVTAVVMVGSVLLGSLIAGSIRLDAGLVAATLGLTALSIRGGPMHCVLQAASSPGIHVLLGIELLILYAIIVLAWSVLWRLHEKGWLQGDAFRDGIEDTDDSLSTKLLAAATQVVVMTLGVMLLAPSDAKAQVLAAVGISAFLATAASHSLFPVRPSIWYWIGPLMVGVFGYGAAYFNGDDAWKIGVIRGLFAPLARPLPLDYASVGTAGAILAYWMSRRWQRARGQTDGKTQAQAS